MSERREEILAIAGEMFATRGFGSTTVREIADAAGILSGSLYHHFDSKESMVDEILSPFLDDLATSYREVLARDDDPVTALRALVGLAFRAVAEHRIAVAVMQNEFGFLVDFPRFAYLRKSADDAEDVWVRVLRAGMRSGAFRADLDPSVVYRFMRDTIWVTVRWYRPAGTHPIDEIRDQYLALLLGGITTRTGVAVKRRRLPATRPSPRRRRA